jgi:hypothetical protein
VALGFYSIVRYSNTLNDQRVNLGVLVWHPVEGFRSRIVSGLDRVHTIDPTAALTPLRSQLQAIEQEMQSESASSETLGVLSRWFRTGVEVTEPAPAKIQSADETAENLFHRLVSPNPFVRSSSQRQFEQSFTKLLHNLGNRYGARVEELGKRNLGDVVVSLGVQTVAQHGRQTACALWKPLSLQSYEQSKLQIAYAKDLAQDISVIKGLPEFHRHSVYVPVKPPKPSASEGLEEAFAWLKRGGATAAFVEGSRSMEQTIEAELRSTPHTRAIGAHALPH